MARTRTRTTRMVLEFDVSYVTLFQLTAVLQDAFLATGEFKARLKSIPRVSEVRVSLEDTEGEGETPEEEKIPVSVDSFRGGESDEEPL